MTEQVALQVLEERDELTPAGIPESEKETHWAPFARAVAVMVTLPEAPAARVSAPELESPKPLELPPPCWGLFVASADKYRIAGPLKGALNEVHPLWETLSPAATLPFLGPNHVAVKSFAPPGILTLTLPAGA